jgi:uncharacterized protein YciI
MKKLITAAALLLLITSMYAQEQKPEPRYEMQTYYFVFLKLGTYLAKDTAESHKITQGHMANIKRMAENGKLKLAGPFIDDTPYIGIFILDVASEEEANELLQSDPAIKIGSFAYDLRRWYGPKGLTVIPDKQ